MRCTGGDDQRVELHRTIREHYLIALQVESFDLRQVNLNVALAAQDAAQRCRDIGGGQAAGGNLIQEWLEKMEVASVQKHDLAIDSAERPGTIEPGESAADDKYAMPMSLPHDDHADALNQEGREFTRG